MADRLKVVYRATASLAPYARNARTHSEAQVAQIAASIKEFGFTNPVLIDPDGTIIAGHGRVLAALKLGMAEVPAIVLGHLTEAQRRALVIADNQISLNAGWDKTVLRGELEALDGLGVDLGLLGFGEGDLARMFDAGGDSGVREVAVDDVEDRFWISVRGPLKEQANALKRLQSLMADMPGVEVELGVISIDV